MISSRRARREQLDSLCQTMAIYPLPDLQISLIRCHLVPQHLRQFTFLIFPVLVDKTSSVSKISQIVPVLAVLSPDQGKQAELLSSVEPTVSRQMQISIGI